MKLSRRWTDADGMGQCDAPASDATFGLRGLLELLTLVAALGRSFVPKRYHLMLSIRRRAAVLIEYGRVRGEESKESWRLIPRYRFRSPTWRV